MIPFILRNWQAVAGVAVAAILATLLWIRTDQRDDARAAYEREHQALILFAERVRAKSETIRANAEARNRRVEQAQAQITQEVSSAYETRLADLRRRADAMRVQLNTARRADSGLGRNQLPGISQPAARADGSPDTDGLLGLALQADENTAKLIALQNWLREVSAIPR